MKGLALILFSASFLAAIIGAGLCEPTPGTTTGGGLLVQGIPIYGITENGDLFWFLHRGFQSGAPDWANRAIRQKVGSEWNEGRLVCRGEPQGRDGVLYRVDSKGDLYWYRHLGVLSGSSHWRGPRKVGVGWQDARIVFSGGPGILYMVHRNGDLNWYRHRGYENGDESWSGPIKVGNGWNSARLAFSAGNGVIYEVDRVGDLYWYKHLGNQTGASNWIPGRKIGSGWGQMVSVVSGGGGVLYATRRDGDLFWYRHDGFADGSAAWTSVEGKKIGSGWDEMVRIF